MNTHDPIGLIRGGAPTDEYDPEVNEFVIMVLKAKSLDEVAVNAVWTRWFGEDYGMPGSEPVRLLTEDLRMLQQRFANEEVGGE